MSRIQAGQPPVCHSFKGFAGVSRVDLIDTTADEPPAGENASGASSPEPGGRPGAPINPAPKSHPATNAGDRGCSGEDGPTRQAWSTLVGRALFRQSARHLLRTWYESECGVNAMARFHQRQAAVQNLPGASLPDKEEPHSLGTARPKERSSLGTARPKGRSGPQARRRRR